MGIINANQNKKGNVIGSFAKDDYKELTPMLENLITGFKSRNLQLSEGADVTKILKSADLKDQLKTMLFEGLGDSAESDFHAVDNTMQEQLFENSATSILRENAIGALAPVVGLSFPMQYVGWINNNMKNLVAHEVPTLPEFVIPVEIPYVMDAAGVQYDLPGAFDESIDTLLDEVNKPLSTAWRTLPIKRENVLTEAGGVPLIDTLSQLFYVTDVKGTWNHDDDDGTTAEKPFEYKVIKDSKAWRDGMIRVEVQDSDTKAYVDTLMGTIDYAKGILTITSVEGNVKEVKIKGQISSESNTHSIEYGWRSENKEYSIGPGIQMNTPITHQYLQDANALFDIEGTKKVLKGMTDVIAQLKDHKIGKGLEDSFQRIKGTKNGPTIVFDCENFGNYTGLPADYVDAQLKNRLFELAGELKLVLNTSIMMTVGGHPRATRNLKNVKWVYTAGETRGGVVLDHGFGIVDNGTGDTFRVVSSERFKDNDLRVVVLPLTENQKTYTNYQYSTYVSNEYRSATKVSIPNIMVNDRHEFEKLFEIQGKIKLENVKHIV